MDSWTKFNLIIINNGHLYTSEHGLVGDNMRSRKLNILKPGPTLTHIKQKTKRKLSFLISNSKMRKLDNIKIPNNSEEIRLFSMMKNESLRLPYFLDYYFSKGVDRLFLIDNGSTDDSVSIALARKNVHVFQTRESFTKYSNWLELLLEKYGKHHWCVAVDMDEIFFYPGAEYRSIRDLSVVLDQRGDTAVRSKFLDMYSDLPIAQNRYKQSDNPFLVCPYFDSTFDQSDVCWMNKHTFSRFTTRRFSGNMRKRVFNVEVNLTKIPFFKYEPGVFIARGVHAIDGAQISNIQGVVFHFKYLQDFNNRVVIEAAIGQHENGAALYKEYAKKVKNDNSLNLFYQGSVRFKDSQQLIGLNLMSDG